MTLVATTPTSSVDQSPPAYPTIRDDDDSLSETSSDEKTSQSRAAEALDYYSDTLVQFTGYPGSDELPQIGCVSIENSNDVHFGNKNIYQGPVTIRQIVYANGNAALEANSDKAKNNLTFEGDIDGVADSFKASEHKGGVGDQQAPVERPFVAPNEGSGFRKGFIWLQNVSKHRPMEIAVFVGLVVLFLVVLMLVLFLRHPSGKVSRISGNTGNSEPDVIKPIEYVPDITATSQIKNKLRMISRIEWVAQPPINTTTPLVTPVQYVIIHHTATENCSSQSQCVFHVRQIQTFHIESRGWYDIGYNFLVGGDGAAYEGRGWTVEGAHTLGWNAQSIGIAFVGTFINRPPPVIQQVAAQKLIARGIDLGYIRNDYKLLGARQLFATESPGTALFEEIKKWPHWAKEP